MTSKDAPKSGSDTTSLHPSNLPTSAPLSVDDKRRVDSIAASSVSERAGLVTNLAQGILDKNTFKAGAEGQQKPELLAEFENFIFVIATLKSMFGPSSAASAALDSSMPQGLKDVVADVCDKDDDDLDMKKAQELARKFKEDREKAPGSIRSKILSVAFSKIGSTAFRGASVDGGNLACAQVATTILCEALKGTGLEHDMDKPILGVAATKKHLLDKKWKLHSGPPKAGDVVIWNRTQKKSNDGNVVLGHGHIGIVIDETRAISNSSSLKMPRIHPFNEGYWIKRGVEAFLSPPDEEKGVA